MPIPEPFASEYRIATTREIRSWSFGEIKKARVSHSGLPDDHVGTLNDQRIFGPIVDDCCACGKYDGPNYRGIVCDRCGVKITTVDERRKRFGHIEVSSYEISHPFDSNFILECFPVIPATYLNSASGRDLCDAYESMLDDYSAFLTLIDILRAMAASSVQWVTVDRDIFTKGLGLSSLT